MSDAAQKKKRIITLILLAFLLLSLSTFLMQREETKTIIVTFPNKSEIEVEVADTPEKLLFGLAFQEALPPNGGMIYIFESTGLNRVTTKEYRFPVDLIWVDESHHIVSLTENVPPCREHACPKYGSGEPVRYVIQTEAGFVKRQGLATGEELKYTLRM
ncbi:conserved exported protein of unknown function [Nitrospira sp. KM1]|nr:conserved exported protein of unknown function [Nitrospira sp. KM1]